jgi:sugar phosphate isomerase/epimerase
MSASSGRLRPAYAEGWPLSPRVAAARVDDTRSFQMTDDMPVARWWDPPMSGLCDTRRTMIEHSDIGISTGAYADRPLAVALARIADLAPSAEIYSSGAHSLLDRKNAGAVADLGLPFNVHGPFTHDGLGNPYEPDRRAAVRMHRRHMKVASRLGATLYIVHPDLQARPAPRNPEIVHALEWSFEELRALQDDLGLPVAVENMAEPDCSHFCAPGDLDLQGLGVVLDVGHAALTGTLGEWLNDPQARLLHVHLHDNQGVGGVDLHLPLA